MTLWAGLLAAGAGRRMGGAAKGLLLIEGETFLARIAGVARRAGVDGVAIVLGHHADLLRGPAEDLCDRVATNPDPARGMLSSARVLARALPPGASMLLWPVDHPAVRLDTVVALIARTNASPGRVVTPVHDGVPGHPPLLPPAVVDALRSASDGRRLDRVVAGAGGLPIEEAVDDAGVVRDVDRPADLDLLAET